MATITEELLRKCAEHNESEIFSLEEVSLHQRNIKKIENIDKWCRDLKILYLHSNLISKIENLNRLKKLEYVNFTLNNITRIENLEGLESLKKLDFTINFIGELTSIESLQGNYNVKELYLTGNPCTEFEGYREYVIATLPQLVVLDGEKIMKSERIVAMQKYIRIRGEILDQQRRYLKNVNFNSENISENLEDNTSEDEKSHHETVQKDFWKQQTKYTPQSRIEMYKHLKKTREKNEGEIKKPKPPRRLLTNDGRILNVNEAQLKFEFIDDEENNCYKLNLAVHRYLDTSSLDADVQPNYVRIKVRGKYFQLLLPEEIHPDLSTSQRSQTTGHLLITMPKANGILIDRKNEKNLHHHKDTKDKRCEFLENTPCIINSIDKIVNHDSRHSKAPDISMEESSPYFKENLEFIDDPSVPPLI